LSVLISGIIIIATMDQTYSTTFTPDRERGQHLKFEDRCSIKIYKKLGY